MTEAPAWLEGHLAPVPDEIDALDLEVTGTLPPELTGRFFRNGPNPRPGEASGHWFTGHGMIHGVRLRDGRAEWYRNRWVRTTQFTDDAPFVREDLTFDRAAVPANTHVVPHADKIFALVEVGFPYELTPELDTVGPCDFGGRLTTAMTAHPKQDPVTGELLFFGYGFLPPYLTYHRLSAAGELVESREIPAPGPTMMHDFAITENYVVWLDLPMVFDLDLAAGGAGMPYRWDDGYGARIGVMPRAGGDVRWFDVEPCYVFHVGNAHERDGKVVLDGARYRPDDFRTLWTMIGGSADPALSAGAGAATLHRWTFDPATGRAAEEALDDRNIEFPTHDDDRTGREHRYLYAVGGAVPGAGAGSIVKYDLATGGVTAVAAELPGEAVFVPAADRTSEDDGWLLSVVDGRELVVLDATDLTRTASIRLPRRVPAGFHGSWIPDA
ncbi:carotenoid oxygenase family protein [Actinomadura atramentaria]|uniref:carotenoid oxygenase family protein n=1 Tax=Actinomadura atramentaria TaxID=1990 RepID=UPI00036D00A8|nr:carotenoid oxygenase family protein [Actinomadura atramentaria]